jgi:hypothetical protein
MMKLIIICGGGSKTTLTKKYQDLFLDIDEFVWSSHNMQYHKQLSEAIAIEDINTISSIYKSIIYKHNLK